MRQNATLLVKTSNLSESLLTRLDTAVDQLDERSNSDRVLCS